MCLCVELDEKILILLLLLDATLVVEVVVEPINNACARTSTN